MISSFIYYCTIMKLLSVSFWLSALLAATLFPETHAHCWFGIWGDCGRDRGSSTTRPSGREQVLCKWWCPSGYNRRGVTIGPSCRLWHGFGKCVDETAYQDESCHLEGGTPACYTDRLTCEQNAARNGAKCQPSARFLASDRTHLKKASKKVSLRHD